MSAVAAFLAAPLPPILGQSDHKDHAVEGNLLPATTGAPLTIKPLNMQDIDCVVGEWRSNKEKTARNQRRRTTRRAAPRPDEIFGTGWWLERRRRTKRQEQQS